MVQPILWAPEDFVEGGGGLQPNEHYTVERARFIIARYHKDGKPVMDRQGNPARSTMAWFRLVGADGIHEQFYSAGSPTRLIPANKQGNDYVPSPDTVTLESGQLNEEDAKKEGGLYLIPVTGNISVVKSTNYHLFIQEAVSSGMPGSRVHEAQGNIKAVFEGAVMTFAQTTPPDRGTGQTGSYIFVPNQIVSLPGEAAQVNGTAPVAAVPAASDITPKVQELVAGLLASNEPHTTTQLFIKAFNAFISEDEAVRNAVMGPLTNDTANTLAAAGFSVDGEGNIS